MQNRKSNAVPDDKNSGIFEIINNRRSIRKFSDKIVSNTVLEKILKAGVRAPFAAQLCSVIYTSDPQKMERLREMGVYPTTKVLMIFLIDVRRLEKIITQRGKQYVQDDGMTLWLGIQDVSLVVENIILAAESLGLGSVLLGVAPQKADLLAEIFSIPLRVYPVVGLCLGYPDPSVETDIRPRFPLELTVSEDSYRDLSDSEIQACMKAMDEGYLAQGYYIKLRAKIPLKEGKDDIDYDRYSWSEHISRKFCQGRPTEEPLFAIIKRHGFNVE
ncbi:MAG: nitroreductase family protein [Candidatus Odinarchaeota archaeon]